MSKKCINILLSVVLIGGNSIVMCQDKGEKNDLRKLVESLKSESYKLPQYDHRMMMRQENNIRQSHRRKAGYFLKSGRFWVLMAVVGGE